jgi:hypothetical protein
MATPVIEPALVGRVVWQLDSGVAQEAKKRWSLARQPPQNAGDMVFCEQLQVVRPSVIWCLKAILGQRQVNHVPLALTLFWCERRQVGIHTMLEPDLAMVGVRIILQ